MAKSRRRNNLHYWKLLRFLRGNLLLLVSLGLFAISLYFFIQVEAYRDSIGQAEAADSQSED